MFDWFYNSLFPFCGDVLGFFSAFAFRRYYDVQFYLQELFTPNALAMNYYNIFTGEYVVLPYNLGGFFENIPILSDVLDFISKQLWKIINAPVNFLTDVTGWNELPFVLGFFFSITVLSFLFGLVSWLFKLVIKR